MESLLTLEDVIYSTDGILLSNRIDFFCFTSVVTDSREVKKDSLFVPLIGTMQNGHNYITNAIVSGASVIFVKKSEYDSNESMYFELAEKNTSVSFIIVENTLNALQDLAEKYVQKFPNLIKIAITGSSGKTTTKEMIVSILKKKYRTVYSKGNFNSETGLPLSVFTISDKDEVGVFEMGMNRQGEISEISRVLKAPYALVTNIGNAHIGLLGSKEKIAEEKKAVFDYVTESGAAFIPSFDEYADFLSRGIKGKCIFFGKDDVSFIKDNGIFGSEFRLGNETIHLKLPGSHNYQNALASISVAKYFDISDKDIKDALETFSASCGRSEIKTLCAKNKISFTLVDDCYNANPESVKAALNFCASVENIKNKIFVLGDMKELGIHSKDAHKKVIQAALEKNASLVILVGDDMHSAYQEMNIQNTTLKCFLFYDDDAIKNIAELILQNIQEDTLVLLKASRSIALERLIPLIQSEVL